jgi:hypothetical protein
MNNYNKPEILVVDGLAEGIYASSGSSGASCESLYMNGVFTVGTYSPITDGYKIGRGCEGCHANWGKCAIGDPNLNPDQDFRPSWEKAGKGPDEKGY